MDQKTPIAKYLPTHKGTTNVIRHLKDKHAIIRPKSVNEDAAESSSTVSMPHQTITMAFNKPRPPTKRPRTTTLEGINPIVLRQLYINYIAAHNLPLKHNETPEFREMIEYMNPYANEYLPRSHSTITDDLSKTYQRGKVLVKKELSTAISKIHISADNWTSKAGGRAFIGITGRYINKFGNRRQIVLGIKELKGAHTGENMAEMVGIILTDFSIDRNLGYFNADNASNNNTLVLCLDNDLMVNGFEWPHQQYRLRCLGHIINLVMQTFLFGKHPEADMQHKDLPGEEDLKAWKKYGALGKLHAIVTYIYSSPQRRGIFRARSPKLNLIRDNSTRWTSWCDAIERALILRDSLDLWQYQDLEDDEIPRLTTTDWSTLQLYLDFLIPLKDSILATEGYNDGLDKVICSMDDLLSHLEQGRETYAKNKIMLSQIEAAWSVLDKYYTLTDETPVYVAGTEDWEK